MATEKKRRLEEQKRRGLGGGLEALRVMRLRNSAKKKKRKRSGRGKVLRKKTEMVGWMVRAEKM